MEAASTMEECGLPVKSTETKGLSSTARMPWRGAAAASFRTWLISSVEVFFSTVQTRSTMETVGMGTRIARPLSLPLSSGRTSLTALAAPVVVGIMERAAARARRKSLCGKSSSLWSPV